jgi:hypothetical protein
MHVLERTPAVNLCEFASAFSQAANFSPKHYLAALPEHIQDVNFRKQFSNHCLDKISFLDSKHKITDWMVAAAAATGTNYPLFEGILYTVEVLHFQVLQYIGPYGPRSEIGGCLKKRRAWERPWLLI